MSKNNLPDKVLIVDNDATTAGSVKEALERYGIKVLSATDLQTALYLFNQNRLEVACVGMDFEELPGLVLIQKWRNHERVDRRHCGFVLLSGNRGDYDPGTTKLLSELRDIEILKKPFTAIQLLPLLSRARATRARAAKFEEMRTTALKLGEQEDKLDKAVGLIQQQLPELGTRGMEMMIDLYSKHKKFENALQLINPLLEKDTNNVGLINKKGRILLEMGNHAEALTYLEKADLAAPDHLDRINHMAMAYLDHKQPDKAVDKMRQLIEYNPENEDLKFDMFSKLHEYGYDSQAQSLCKETTSPIEVVRYYNNKGIALKNTGRVDDAISEYERSLLFYPKFKENYRIYYNMALAQVSKKSGESYKAALESTTKCLELSPKFDKAQKLKEKIETVLNNKKTKNKAG